ncbi:GIY-YIG nuclease family protein [Burkholderia cepacia]|uniref:GIY-YIG nuclease family protein n=1 Tax=Burkholderia cepacia TaxID=292 RepID=UPI002ABE2BA6|nr:GIY-YIG nuclease family protein [Burkholderia cepacia]
MTTHKDRMADIGAWVIPPLGTPERARLDKFISQTSGDSAHQKKLKETFEKAKALISVQSLNGIGFPADKQIREFNLEYNGRVFRGSLRDMPASFNVAEAFNCFVPSTSTFRIRDERDYIFSFDDFIDFVTSDLVDESKVDLESDMEEGKIYSFNSVDSKSQMRFSSGGGAQYEFASVSLVRFGSEISLILLAGQECDLLAETEKIKKSAWESTRPLSHRVHIEADECRELRAEPLFENSNLWKTVVLVRFDNSKKTIDARYVFQDWGRMYRTISDDVDGYLGPDGQFLDEMKEVYLSAKTSILVHSALFELCKTCLLIPAYARYFESDIVVERHPTELLDFRKKVSNRKTVSLVGAKYLLGHREVFRIPSRNQRSSTSSAFLAPEYNVETSGYWKRLGPRDVGRDKNGAVIHGRTWVSQTLSWVQESTENEALIAARPRPTSDADNCGFIYVMRSAAHERDIFKVGLTRRTSDIRSAELSRTTGSPDLFLVVQEWAVADCVAVERAVHQRLEKYRINPKREFFRAPYNVIFSAIDETIRELEPGA